MKKVYKTYQRWLFAMLLGCLLLPRTGLAQTTLGVGDIAFTGLNANGNTTTGDTISFVLLANITANTTISFSDRGYNGGAYQAAGTSEGCITWTTNVALAAGTEVVIGGLTSYTYNTSTGTKVACGTVATTDGTMAAGLNLSNIGDQVIAFQGGSGVISNSGVTNIAGLHYFNCTAGSTTSGSWDTGCSSVSSSAMPPGLTGGTNAIWLTGVYVNAKYDCSNGENFTTAAQVKAAVMDPTKWLKTSLTSPTSTYKIPSGCNYLSTAPVITTQPSNRTICNNATTTLPLVATNATSYQWEENSGSGFVNASGAAYSGATTATLSITGTSAMTGYTYRCHVSNAGSSVYSNTVTLTVSGLTAATSATNTSCNGLSNGRASVTPSGGATPYTYMWSPSGGTAALATGLSAGSYTCTVTDNSGCTYPATVSVTQPSAINAVVSATAVTCNGGNNGIASVSASGGTPSYFYSWAPSGGTGATATSLSAGAYTVTVTDNNSCTATKTVAVTQPSALSASGSTVNVSCNGFNNGITAVSVSGGTSPYTYTWSPTGGNSPVAVGQPAGSYTCNYTDSKGCTGSKNFIVTQPPALVGTPSFTNIICNGTATGEASVSVSGGTPGYTYTWSPSGGNNPDASALSAGTYTCNIEDVRSCPLTVTLTITEPTAMVITPTSTNVTCNGNANGIAKVTVSGGTPAYTYSWSPSGGTAATASGLAPNAYTVSITDANNCNVTQTITITQPSALVTPTAVTNVACYGGTNGVASVTPSGGTSPYTYSWTPGGATTSAITGLSAGTYSVVVTDANGCTSNKVATISQPSSSLTATSSTTMVACFGGNTGRASVSASGGTPSYAYSWAPSGGTAATATGLSAGTYTCTITDVNSCQFTRTVSITQPASAPSAAATATAVSCNGGTNGRANVTASGGTPGYTYSWTPSGGTAALATGLSAGTYTCRITDANNCTGTTTISVTQPVVLAATITSTNVSCNGGNNAIATTSVTGGTSPYTYSWTPSGGTAATASGLAAGNYTVTVTDNNACVATQTVSITQPAALSATSTSTNVSCNGGTNGIASVSASGGTTPYTYAWTPSGGTAATATGLAANNYSCVITDAKACTITKTLSITAPSAITAVASATNITCNGAANGMASVSASGGTSPYTYSWAPSGGTGATASGLGSGNYTCTVTDANSCTKTASISVTHLPP